MKSANVAKAWKIWFDHQSKEVRKIHAGERQAVREVLTPQQQLAVLDRRLGKGIGAARERARLAKSIK
jgi:Spy/CpxP family protein refolding chaperone